MSSPSGTVRSGTVRSGTIAERLQGRRVGVALSSAYFGFFAHAGFLAGLRARGLEPAAYAGTSSGALVSAFAAAGMSLESLVGVLSSLKRRDFWDPKVPWPRPRRTPHPPGLLKGQKFSDLLTQHLPVERFEACQTPLVTVSTNITRGHRHVDTTGPLVPAIHASCALPLLFQPVERDGDLHVDGGLMDKVPVRALVDAHPLDALVVHYIPSRGLSAPPPRAPWGMMDHALDLVRDDGWRLQADLARAQGVEVFVVETRTTGLGPLKLRHGPRALDEARTQTLEHLDAPA